MMIACCVIPLILVLVLGTGAKTLGASSWTIFGGVAVMLLAHSFMMRGRGHSNKEQGKQDDADKEDKNKKDKNHSGHGCCH